MAAYLAALLLLAMASLSPLPFRVGASHSPSLPPPAPPPPRCAATPGLIVPPAATEPARGCRLLADAAVPHDPGLLKDGSACWRGGRRCLAACQTARGVRCSGCTVSNHLCLGKTGTTRAVHSYGVMSSAWGGVVLFQKMAGASVEGSTS